MFLISRLLLSSKSQCFYDGYNAQPQEISGQTNLIKTDKNLILDILLLIMRQNIYLFLENFCSYWKPFENLKREGRASSRNDKIQLKNLASASKEKGLEGRSITTDTIVHRCSQNYYFYFYFNGNIRP